MDTSSTSTAGSPPPFEGARLVIAMGVSSSGKTTVGKLIAEELSAPFLEGDDYHPESNIKKMSAGIPLTDDDRWPWLDSMGKALHEAAEKAGLAVGACSALKRAYRDRLVEAAGEPIVFVYLDGSYAEIDRRMKARKNHFMPESLLKSQFATLQPPGKDENAIDVPIAATPQIVADEAMEKLGYLKAFRRGR
jgi:carbohydrate kinase (thermoresistant glucokinase family)